MSSWANIQTIAKRELAAISPPLAFVIIVCSCSDGFFSFMIGFLLERREASLYCSSIASLALPVSGASHRMRLWSEERRMAPWNCSSPCPSPPGRHRRKILASWAFSRPGARAHLPVILTVNYLGHPDNGIIFCGYIGSFLLAGAYLAISCLTSAMTRNQVISFIISWSFAAVLLAGFPRCSTCSPVGPKRAGGYDCFLQRLSAF